MPVLATLKSSCGRMSPRSTCLLHSDSHDEISSHRGVKRSHDDAILARSFALEDNLGAGAAPAVIVFGELLALRVLDTEPVVPPALAVDLVGFARFKL